MLTKFQQNVLEALKDTALGREGLIVDTLFKRNVISEINDLIKDGLVVEINSFISFKYLPNGTYYGLAGEEYPQNEEEWSRYSNTGASKKISFSEFKQALKDGEYDERKEEKGQNKLDKYWNDHFKSKSKKYYLNYFKRDLSESIVAISENIRSGMSPEDNIFDLFVRFSTDDIIEDVHSGEFLDEKFVIKWLVNVLENKMEK